MAAIEIWQNGKLTLSCFTRYSHNHWKETSICYHQIVPKYFLPSGLSPAGVRPWRAALARGFDLRLAQKNAIACSHFQSTVMGRSNSQARTKNALACPHFQSTVMDRSNSQGNGPLCKGGGRGFGDFLVLCEKSSFLIQCRGGGLTPTGQVSFFLFRGFILSRSMSRQYDSSLRGCLVPEAKF